MGKLDIGVGDEFPLDESRSQDNRHAARGHHRGHEHERRRSHHHRRLRSRGFGRFAMVLVIVGLIALIVEHKLSAAMAYGMIGLGATLLVAAFVLHVLWHWRHHHAMPTPPSQLA